MFTRSAMFYGLLAATASAGIVTTNVGGDATIASIQPAVDNFRILLGTNNGVGGSFGSGRREINWDGVAAGFSDPNFLPANFFNANSPRGLVMSSNAGNLLVTTNGLSDFAAFSAAKFLALTGAGNQLDVTFFIPGTATAATVSGFGAVFLDADFNIANIEAFYANGTSAGVFDVADTSVSTLGFSFLGISGNAGERFSRFRLTLGDGGTLLSGTCLIDCVMVDDFIYGEPQAAIPEPAPLVIVSAGLTILALLRRQGRAS